MLYKIGIVLDNLHSSQMSYYAIRNVNQYLMKSYLTNFNFYVRDTMIPCILPECGTMRWQELWGFTGKLIATNLDSIKVCMTVPGNFELFYYLNDVDWMRYKNRPRYEELLKIYNNPDIKLITDSEDISKEVQRCWNNDVLGVARNFNLDTILNLMNCSVRL